MNRWRGQTLARKLNLLLLLPLLASSFGVGCFVLFLKQTKKTAYAIDTAGRQRARCAELGAWARMVALGQDEDRPGLSSRVREFDEALSLLARGSDPGAAARPELAAVSESWAAVRPDLEAVAALPSGRQKPRRAYERALSRLPELCSRTDDVVKAVERHLDALRLRVLWALAAGTLLALLAFLGGAVLARRQIVAPALRVDAALRQIVEGTAVATGGDFFRPLARHLAQALDVKAVVLARIVAAPARSARTLAVWAGGGYLPDMEYPVAGTPCEKAAAGEFCFHGRGLQDLFPAAPMVKALAAQSYLGVPLVGSQGQVIGHLAVLDDKPMQDEEYRRKIVAVLAARAGAELGRVIAAEALAQSERRFRDLLECSPDAVVVSDERGRIVMVNRRAEDMFGYSRSELVAMGVESLMPERYRARHEGHRAGYAAKPVPRPMGAHLDLHAARKDGTEFPVDVAISPVEAPEGSLFMSSIRDITARVMADRRIRELASIIESSPEAVVVTDTSGTIRYVNAGWESISGWLAQEVVGKTTPRVQKSDKTDPAVYRELWRTIARGEVYRGEFVNRHKGGRLYDSENLIVPIKDKAGAITGYAGFQHEITERKRLWSAVHQSEKLAAVGQLAAGVAHELNNPLGVILGFAQSLARGVGADDPKRLAVTSIERESRRCRDLIQDLLAFSRTSRQEDRKQVDLGKTVAAALSLVEAKAKINGVEIVREFEGEPIVIQANASQIQQVVINLCVNAIDAMPGAGKLTVSLSREVGNGTGRVKLAVADTGSGIPDEIRAKVFEPFFTTKEPGSGTGLGLSLVHEIVQRHGGTVEFESAVGRGTAFRVFLPA